MIHLLKFKDRITRILNEDFKPSKFQKNVRIKVYKVLAEDNPILWK